MRLVLMMLLLGGCRVPPPGATIDPVPTSAPTKAPTLHESAVPVAPEPEPVSEPPPDVVEAPRPRVAIAGRLGPTDPAIPAKPRSESVCGEHERRALRTIKSLARGCTTADDCELRASLCPFGCYHAVSKQADRAPAERAIGRYLKNCKACKYKCARTPEALACQDSVCVVVRQSTRDADQDPPSVEAIINGAPRDAP